MKIQSRPPKSNRYKIHRVTSARRDVEIATLHLASSYIPTDGCPPDAQSSFSLSFGMDGRRFVVELSRAETKNLSDELIEALQKAYQLRRIK